MDGPGAHHFGHEVGVAAHAVAVALDLHDGGVVQKPVQQGRGYDGIAEDLIPFGEAAVGGRIIAPRS